MKNNGQGGSSKRGPKAMARNAAIDKFFARNPAGPTTAKLPGVGMRLRYLGTRFGMGSERNLLRYADPGDIATVVAKHAAIPGTGILLRRTSDGDPLYDTGIPAWIVAQFENGLRVAVDAESLSTWESMQ